MKPYYYKDNLTVWDRRRNERIASCDTLENALLITDALNDEFLFREKAQLQGSGAEQRASVG